MRRAWVERIFGVKGHHNHIVALHAEGVGRKLMIEVSTENRILSPSMRRAWVERTVNIHKNGGDKVALRVEGVGRKRSIGLM